MKTKISVVVAIAASLIALACGQGRWELVRTDALSDGVPILALYFTDSDHGWAITPGELLKLVDRGNGWTTVLSNEDARRSFYSFAFANAKTGVIVGTQKVEERYTALILQTSNGGETWESRPVHVTKDTRSVALQSVRFCNSDVAWAVGDGLIVRTADGGKTWETQRSEDSEERMFAIACTSPQRAWAVGPNGLLLRTTDAGKTWSREAMDPEYALVRVRFFGDEGWILGGVASRGLLLRTSDGGVTWKRQAIDTSGSLMDIYIDGLQGWLIGSNGMILYTSDGGRSWENQHGPTTNDLGCLFFISPNKGWAAGAKRTLLRFRG